MVNMQVLMVIQINFKLTEHFRFRWADLFISEFIKDRLIQTLEMTVRTVLENRKLFDRLSLMEILKSTINSI